MVGGDGDSIVEGTVRERQISYISLYQYRRKFILTGVFPGVFQHHPREIDPTESEIILERQEVGTVTAADIQQAALRPSFSEFIQFIPEYGPVPEIVPARGYLIEYFSGPSHTFFGIIPKMSAVSLRVRLGRTKQSVLPGHGLPRRSTFGVTPRNDRKECHCEIRRTQAHRSNLYK